MPSSTNSELELLSLPREILCDLVTFLDVEALLKCRRVCRTFRDIIDESPQSQYKFELMTAGAEDGPDPMTPISDRRIALKRYMDNWDNLKWIETPPVKMQRGGLWELFGGVLAQNSPTKTFNFTRLPSISRGIQQKSWEVPKLPFEVRDFSMDLAQDLWVVVQKARQAQNGMFNVTSLVYEVHLFSLERSPGDPHPLAKGGHSLTMIQEFIDPAMSFSIQISGTFLGIQAHTQHAGLNELYVWNWKTGERKMHLVGDELRGFSFLSDRHVLLAALNHNDADNQDIVPTLSIIDFTQTFPDGNQPVLSTKAITLWYPPLRDNVAIISFEVRADPAPSWEPGRSSNIPFHLAKNNRIYVVSLWVVEQGENIPQLLLLFIHSKTLTSIVTSYEAELSKNDGVYVQWANWGPEGTRMTISPVPLSMTWVCYVYGTRYVALEAHQTGLQKVWCRVYDFNDLPIRRGQTEVDQENIITEDAEISPQICDSAVYQVGPMTIKGGKIFQNDVTTSLPFRWRSAELDILASERNCAIMCSEDNIILVDAHDMKHRILTF